MMMVTTQNLTDNDISVNNSIDKSNETKEETYLAPQLLTNSQDLDAINSPRKCISSFIRFGDQSLGETNVQSIDKMLPSKLSNSGVKSMEIRNVQSLMESKAFNQNFPQPSFYCKQFLPAYSHDDSMAMIGGSASWSRPDQMIQSTTGPISVLNFSLVA